MARRRPSWNAGYRACTARRRWLTSCASTECSSPAMVSQQRQGPTVGMALVSIAHYQHPDVEMVRVGAMAPMFPFSGGSGGQLGITTDHRAFYDIMRRLRALYSLDIDLSDLRPRYEEEASRLLESLDRVAQRNDEARRYIDRVRNDYQFQSFEEPVELDPSIEGTLADILGQFDLPGDDDDNLAGAR